MADTDNYRIQKFNAAGTYQREWSVPGLVYGIAADGDGYIYTTEYNNDRVRKYNTSGTYQTQWGSTGTGNDEFENPEGIDSDGTYIYVVDDCGIRVFDLDGDFEYRYIYGDYGDIAVDSGDIFVVGDFATWNCWRITPNWAVQLEQVDETTGSKTSRTKYFYDSYGNVTRQENHGDTSTTADDSTVWKLYYPDTDDNILSLPARVRTYKTIQTTDNGDSDLQAQTLNYYDQTSSYTTAPTEGNLRRVRQYKDSSNSVNTYYTYDSYGNMLTEQDPNAETTTYTYDTTYYTYPITITYPITGLSESATYDAGTNNILTHTDENGQTTTYEYDTFKRMTKRIEPGDTSGSPTKKFEYLNWGTLNQQRLKCTTKIDGSNSLWKAEYFDGLGRTIQVHAEGESGYTVIESTTKYNNRNLVDKQYVSKVVSGSPTSYQTPGGGEKYASYVYDGLGRPTTVTSYDSSSISHSYSSWNVTTTNERSNATTYAYDAFKQLVKVTEPGTIDTDYTYDVLGNLKTVVDDDDNTTSMTYDWLSRKTDMDDPDMGDWDYVYDSNGNLTSQTDAKSQTIYFEYDDLNRLTRKNYPAGIDAYYYYDTDYYSSGTNYPKGKRTKMTDASGTTVYKYDTRSRLIGEKRTIDSTTYTTTYTYDSADQIKTVTYPTGETVTNNYNGRGLEYSLSGTTAGTLVDSAYYNALGLVTEINFYNDVKTTYGYYGLGGSYDTTGGYYGRLWEIKTTDTGPDPDEVHMDYKYTWDAGSNLATRQDVLASQTETFTYDSLDRLTAVTGPYSLDYTYDNIGNITEMNDLDYDYDDEATSGPHAVNTVGTGGGQKTFTYDDNGNMTDQDGVSITWNYENMPTTIGSTTFVYDGNGQRVKKTVGETTTIYVNKYYDKTGSEVTTHYYLGRKEVAQRRGTTLEYIHQDNLDSSALVTNTSGNKVSDIKYYPYGDTRSGSVNTEKQFTGQHLDSSTDLYYYGARYYESEIGRFISPDSMVPDLMNPQALNRYSYCVNNPLKYVDPDGHWGWVIIAGLIGAVVSTVVHVVTKTIRKEPITVSGCLGAAASGFVTGALASMIGPAAGAFIKGATRGAQVFKHVVQAGLGAANTLAGQAIEKGVESIETGKFDWDWKEAGMAIGTNYVAGALVDGLASKGNFNGPDPFSIVAKTTFGGTISGIGQTIDATVASKHGISLSTPWDYKM